MASSINSVAQGFKELLARVELNPARTSLASQRYKAVSDRIQIALPSKEVRQIGSFQRKTKIRPLDNRDTLDIDAIVCFGDARKYAIDGSGVSPAQAIDAVRKALETDRTYKLMKPESDAPTVILSYADGFSIELVPCYREVTGKYPRNGGPSCYIVGTPSGSWVPADYDYDAAVISGLNQLSTIEQSIVPSIKMVKAFLRGKQVGLKSFHIEILCSHLIPKALFSWQGKHWGYHHVLAYFLSNAHSLLDGPVGIPNSYSPKVDSGWNAFSLTRIGQTLVELGKEAWEICGDDSEARALGRWREFFGDPFPA